MSTPYIPALHFRWLTARYDFFMQRLYPEATLKQALIAQAQIQPGWQVLDLGCGTGTLALLIKRHHPDVIVHGIDMDSQILEIAHNKIEQAGKTLNLTQGSATSLPYPDQCFERVFASLMLHHLTRADKQRACAEVFRVLKPGGEWHVADFGPPHDWSMWLISLVIRWAEEIHDNIHGLLPVFMANAGFHNVATTACYRTVSGTLALYRAYKPGTDD